MVNRPSLPEIITVNSEDLQTAIRDLLPSQNGFGSELQATNVITPIIDLTPTAEGSTLPVSMQQALAFGSQTEFVSNNSTVTVLNTTGFFRVFGTSVVNGNASGTRDALFQMSDGLATKNIWGHLSPASATLGSTALLYDFIVFLRAGDTLSASTNSLDVIMRGSTRQVADAQGTLVNPSGFPV